MFGFGKKAASTEVDGLRTLTGRVEDMEATVRKLKGEWLDALDRFERIAGRIVKRAQRAALASEASEDESPDSQPTPEQTNGSGASAAMRAVMLRRSRQAYPTKRG